MSHSPPRRDSLASACSLSRGGEADGPERKRAKNDPGPEVKKEAALWRSVPQSGILLSEGDRCATCLKVEALLPQQAYGLGITTTCAVPAEGRHFWLLKIAEQPSLDYLRIGLMRGDAEHSEEFTESMKVDKSVWLLDLGDGMLYGNGKPECDHEEQCGAFVVGDEVGILLDRNVGSLTFFKNGAQFGTGFPKGSVAGRVHMGGHMRAGQVLRLVDNPD